MAKLPGKLHDAVPSSVGKVADREGQNPAALSKKAAAQGIALTEAAAENMTPDYEIGGVPEAGSEDGERQVTPTANKWPEAKPVARKPYKF